MLSARSWLSTLLLAVLPFTLAAVLAEGPAAPPPASQWAPAPDLAQQAKALVAELEKSLASAEEYDDSAKERVVKHAHALAVAAKALGLHDTPNEYQAAAPALVQAAQQLAAAADYSAAQAALAAVVSAMQGQAAEAPALNWGDKTASLGKLMKHVTFVNNRLKRGVKRLDREGDEAAGNAAMLAAIAQAVQVDTHEVKDASQVGLWYELCGQMRDRAGEVNAAIHQRDQAAVDAAMRRLAVSCEDCHKVFRTEE